LLGTDTNLFILQLFVDDIKQALTGNPRIREELDFGSVPEDHPSGLGDPDDPNASVVGKFKEELNLDPIIQWVGLRPKMYSLTSCKATKWDPTNPVRPVERHKQVSKGCSRPNIKQFTPDDYVRMYRGVNAHVIVNRRIGSNLHQVYHLLENIILVRWKKLFYVIILLTQVYTLEQSKRGLCPYDDKRYLLADLADGVPNPNTHAYGHKDLAGEEQVVAEIPDSPGTELLVKRREQRFLKQHARVVARVTARGRRDSNGDLIEDNALDEIPDGDQEGELRGAELERAERAAAARPGGRGRLDNPIDLIARINNFQVPPSPPPRMPPSQDRAGPSRTNRPGPPTKSRRFVYSSDEEDAPPPVWPPPPAAAAVAAAAAAQPESSEDEAPVAEPRRKRRRSRRPNPFIDAEAGVDGEASADEDDSDAKPTMGGFIVEDD
jgi:hypothetical protein